MAKGFMHPSSYPIGWLTATEKASRLALLELPEWEKWVSIDWARGESGAVERMKRLRRFRDGLEAHQFEYPWAGEALAKGFRLGFRKQIAAGVWDIKVGWIASSGISPETLAILQEIRK